MTKQTSLNKCSRKMHFFKLTLKKQTPITLLITAFALLICPGILLNEISNRLEYNEIVDMSQYFDGFTIFIFLIGIAEMLILTMMNFSFLYSKKSGDVFHALPLTRNELLYLRLIPSFIGGAFTMTVCYFSLTVLNFMPRMDGIDITTIIITYFAMLTMLFICTLFSSIFAVCSGTVFDFIIAIGAVTVAIPVLYMIGRELISDITEGIVINNDIMQYRFTSPFILALTTVSTLAANYITPVSEEFWNTGSDFNYITVLITIVIGVFFAWAVSKLFKIRKSEFAGEAYAFGFMPKIISLLVSVVGGYVLALIFTGGGFSHLDFWVYFIIGALLCAVSAGAIFSRGFKTVKKSLIRGAIAVGVSILLCIILVFSAGYAETYVPRTEDIKMISVGNYENAVFYDNFDIITNIHKAAVEDIKNGTTYDFEKDDDIGYVCIVNTVNSIKFTYKLKSGREVTRRYTDLYAQKYDELLIKYMQSEEYLERFNLRGEFNGALSVSYRETYEKYDETKMGSIDITTAKKLYAAYTEELKNAKTEAFYEPVSTFEVNGYNQAKYSEGNYFEWVLYVPTSFTKTREIINSLELFTDEEIKEMEIEIYK